MKIKIDNVETNSNHWYSGCVGQVFDVVEVKGEKDQKVYTVKTNKIAAGQGYVLEQHAVEVEA